MKKILPSVIAVLFFGAGLVGAFFFFRDSEEKQLRRMLDELCEIVQKSSGENHAVSGLKANRADKIFAPRCEIKFGRHLFDGSYTPTELGANIMRFKSIFKELDISYSELTVAISDTPAGIKAAKLFFTGKCSGTLKNSPEKVNEIRDLEAIALKGEKGWRLCAVTIVKVLEK